MLRVLKAFFPSVILAYLLASVAATQIILHKVASMGLAVELSDRLRATLHDLLGLSSSYLVLILLALVLAFPVAAGLSRLLPTHRTFLFALAGFAGLLVLHLIMNAVFGITAIAATRSLPGLLSQALAGAAGGFAYAVLSRPGLRPRQ